MTPPKKPAIIAVACGIAALSAILGVRFLYPAARAVTSPRLQSLRGDRAVLEEFTASRAIALETKLADQKKGLWTPENFSAWRKSLPEGWSLQELGAVEALTVKSKRYALSRNNATDRTWTEILTTLRQLERAGCVNVQSVSLSTEPGNSRRFKQCLITAVFHFSQEPKS